VQSDNEKNKEENMASSTEQLGKALLSEREICAIVRDFITAYISGQIKINWADADFILLQQRKRGYTIDYDQAVKMELDAKNAFNENVAICAGTKKATPEELQKAIGIIFEHIMIFRHGKRIEGVFTDYNIEQRISRLEEGMEKINNLVQEIVEWIYEGVTEQ